MDYGVNALGCAFASWLMQGKRKFGAMRNQCIRSDFHMIPFVPLRA